MQILLEEHPGFHEDQSLLQLVQIPKSTLSYKFILVYYSIILVVFSHKFIAEDLLKVKFLIFPCFPLMSGLILCKV